MQVVVRAPWVVFNSSFIANAAAAAGVSVQYLLLFNP